MERQTTNGKRKLNLILTCAVIAAAGVLAVVCLLLRPKTGTPDRFVIRYGDGETIEISARETRTVIIRDGKPVETEDGTGAENVIRIENGTAWMEHANCPHQECVKQGRLNAETVGSRPLGTWIVCAPHRVYIEFMGGGQ